MKIGYDVKTEEPFEIDTEKFLKTHTFIQAITGGGKTGSLTSLIEKLKSKEVYSRFGYIPVVIIDDRDEFLNIPKSFDDFRILDSEGKYKELFTIDQAESVGRRVREISADGVSMILKLSDFKTNEEKEMYVSNFLNGFRIQDRKHWTPCVLIIDEADILCPTTGKGGRKNSRSRDTIIDACKRARKEGIAIILATQHSSSVHIDARRQCDNRMIGNTVELSDRRVAGEMLGEKKITDELWGLDAGKFFVRGKAFGYELKKIQIDKPQVKPPTGIETEQVEEIRSIDSMTIPSDGNVIKSMEEQITLLTSNQLTQEKYNQIFEKGRKAGYEQAMAEYKGKSLADRLLKR